MVEFLDWLPEHVGTRMWVVAPRLTPRLKANGYDLAIPSVRYDAFYKSWQREHYGAPLDTLHAASPDLLAALKDALAMLPNFPAHDPEHSRIERMRAAISKAEGVA